MRAKHVRNTLKPDEVLTLQCVRAADVTCANADTLSVSVLKVVRTGGR
jgi:hypothetical protein